MADSGSTSANPARTRGHVVAGIDGHTRVTIRGKLIDEPILIQLPNRGGPFTEVNVACDYGTFAIQAAGQLAETICGFGSKGSDVTAKGRLQEFTHKTEGGSLRSRVVIQVEEAEIVGTKRPEDVP